IAQLSEPLRETSGIAGFSPGIQQDGSRCTVRIQTLQCRRSVTNLDRFDRTTPRNPLQVVLQSGNHFRPSRFPEHQQMDLHVVSLPRRPTMVASRLLFVWEPRKLPVLCACTLSVLQTMAEAHIPSPAFYAAELRSERVRIFGVLGFLAVVA